MKYTDDGYMGRSMTDPADHHFEVRTAPDSGRTLFELSGELDGPAGKALVAAVTASPPGDGVPLELDMSGVSFIDSTGVASLVGLKHEHRDAPVVLINPRYQAIKILTVLQLTSLFEIRLDAHPDTPGEAAET